MQPLERLEDAGGIGGADDQAGVDHGQLAAARDGAGADPDVAATSVAVFGAGVAVFNSLVYGGPFSTGYHFMAGSDQVTFGLGAIVPNLRRMPAHLVQALPMLVLGLAALAWIIARAVTQRAPGAGSPARRDLWVGLALAASWLAIWGVYSAYYWTNDPSEDTLQTVRFYVPAIGSISLLGAWLVTRIPGRIWRPVLTSVAVITALFGLGAWSFYAMCAASGVPLGG